jgi:hypothetical protein
MKTKYGPWPIKNRKNGYSIVCRSAFPVETYWVKIDYGGLFSVSSHFSLKLQLLLNNVAHFKNGQKCLRNNHFASGVYICNTFPHYLGLSYEQYELKVHSI